MKTKIDVDLYRKNICHYILILNLLLCVGCAGSCTSHSSLPSPYNMVKDGMSSSDVIKHLGVPDRELNSTGVYGVDKNTDLVWYYTLPKRSQDFDSRYFVIEFNSGNVVIASYEYSN